MDIVLKQKNGNINITNITARMVSKSLPIQRVIQTLIPSIFSDDLKLLQVLFICLCIA